jgi:hypothetical protein
MSGGRLAEDEISAGETEAMEGGEGTVEETGEEGMNEEVEGEYDAAVFLGQAAEIEMKVNPCQ